MVGPAYVGGYVLTQCLHHTSPVKALAILYAPQILCCIVLLQKEHTYTQVPYRNAKIEVPRLKTCFQILDTSIKNGFETMMILGGYLILFGILSAFFARLNSLPVILKSWLMAIFEVSSGVREISLLLLTTEEKLMLLLPLLSFGGLCTLMQTKSMIKEVPLSIKSYLLHKTLFAWITVGLLFILY